MAMAVRVCWEEGLGFAAIEGMVEVAEPGGLGDQALDAQHRA
jgi:hypothetical protein